MTCLPCIYPCDPESIEKDRAERESVCVRVWELGKARTRNTKFLVLSCCEIGITDSAVGAPRVGVAAWRAELVRTTARWWALRHLILSHYGLLCVHLLHPLGHTSHYGGEVWVLAEFEGIEVFVLPDERA